MKVILSNLMIIIIIECLICIPSYAYSGQSEISINSETYCSLGTDPIPLFKIPLKSLLTNPCNFNGCEEWYFAVADRFFDFDPESCEQWLGDCNAESPVYRPGNVVLGDQGSHGSYKFTSYWDIYTERLSVCASQWCDYVFEPDYLLMSLEDLEIYIQKNGHLPGVISQKQIEDQEGYDLNSIILMQQEKIEEIFLYLIALEEEIINLEKKK